MNLTDRLYDLGAVRAKAVPADDGTWRITGQKIFTFSGTTWPATSFIIGPGSGCAPGQKGVSCFIVPKYLVNDDGSPGARNDLRCVSIEHRGGSAPARRASCRTETQAAIGYLIGEANEGMRYMFTMMNTARLYVGIQGLSMAERAYQDGPTRYAQEHIGQAGSSAPARASHHPIVEYTDVRRMLMKAYIEAMRALLYTHAVLIDLARNTTVTHQQALGENWPSC